MVPILVFAHAVATAAPAEDVARAVQRGVQSADGSVVAPFVPEGETYHWAVRGLARVSERHEIDWSKAVVGAAGDEAISLRVDNEAQLFVLEIPLQQRDGAAMLAGVPVLRGGNRVAGGGSPPGQRYCDEQFRAVAASGDHAAWEKLRWDGVRGGSPAGVEHGEAVWKALTTWDTVLTRSVRDMKTMGCHEEQLGTMTLSRTTADGWEELKFETAWTRSDGCFWLDCTSVPVDPKPLAIGQRVPLEKGERPHVFRFEVDSVPLTLDSYGGWEHLVRVTLEDGRLAAQTRVFRNQPAHAWGDYNEPWELITIDNPELVGKTVLLEIVDTMPAPTHEYTVVLRKGGSRDY